MIAEEIGHLIAVLDVFPTSKLHAIGIGNVFTHLNAKQAIMSFRILFISKVTVVGAGEFNI